jgi:DNA polymerase-1
VTDWGEDQVTTHADINECMAYAEEMIYDLKAACDADRVLLAFSCDEGNFRKEVNPTYKSNRKGVRKPIGYARTKELLKKKFDSMTRPHLEADDILAILATGQVKHFTGPRIVCSIDKDMKTFPCLLYNWMHPDDGVVKVTRTDADFAFYQQILTGDSTDGYAGCPLIGPVKAERALSPFLVDGDFNEREAWEVIKVLYEKKGLDEDHALMMARCARILRAQDYDFKTRTPILWSPPKGEENG